MKVATMAQMADEHPAHLRLSVQRALIGEVPANLAALSAKLHANTIKISAYYFTPPSEEDIESISEVSTEVIADYPLEYTVEEEIGDISEIDKNQYWDFLRKEAAQ